MGESFLCPAIPSCAGGHGYKLVLSLGYFPNGLCPLEREHSHSQRVSPCNTSMQVVYFHFTCDALEAHNCVDTDSEMSLTAIHN